MHRLDTSPLLRSCLGAHVLWCDSISVTNTDIRLLLIFYCWFLIAPTWNYKGHALYGYLSSCITTTELKLDIGFAFLRCYLPCDVKNFLPNSIVNGITFIKVGILFCGKHKRQIHSTHKNCIAPFLSECSQDLLFQNEHDFR